MGTEGGRMVATVRLPNNTTATAGHAVRCRVCGRVVVVFTPAVKSVVVLQCPCGVRRLYYPQTNKRAKKGIDKVEQSC